MSSHKGDFDVCRTTFGRSFGYSRTVTTTSASTFTLNSFSTGYQIFEGNVGGQILNLGDATTYFKDGYSYIILNDSDNDIIIENNGGTDLYTLKPNFGVIAILEDGSTADGAWRFLLFMDSTLEFISNSAAPSLTWGDSGNVNSGTYLLNDTVPSNLAGRLVFLNEAKIIKLFTASQSLATYDISIYEHDGDEIGLNLLVTKSVISSRGEEFDIDITATKGKHLALRITAGSVKNITAGLSLTGTLV